MLHNISSTEAAGGSSGISPGSTVISFTTSASAPGCKQSLPGQSDQVLNLMRAEAIRSVYDIGGTAYTQLQIIDWCAHFAGSPLSTERGFGCVGLFRAL